MKDVFLYGASGHARVITDIVEAMGGKILGVIDDDKSISTFLGIPVVHSFTGQSPLIISIGNNVTRKMLAERLDARYESAIHPSAVVSCRATIGEGSVVMQGSVVQSGCQIGKHCIINTGASVDHECLVGSYAHVSPHATLCGNVTVGEGAWVGAGATVIQGVKIGRWSMVGAGSVVTKDIPDGWLALGNRCRPIRIINQNMLQQSQIF